MSGTNEKDNVQPGVESVDQARHGIEQAEQGNVGSVEQLDEAEKSDPVGTQAAEQEAADGPPGRGLSR